MKKILSIVFLLVLFTISPVLAIFCHKCGVELPEESSFCPSCGKPVVKAFKEAPPMPSNSENPTTITINIPQQTNNGITTITNTPTKTVKVTASVSTSDYEIVDQIETLLSTSNCNYANIRAKQLILQHNKRMQSIEANYQNFNPYQRELHNLYAQKLKSLRTYLQAWETSESGQYTAKSLAEKDKALFLISHINEAIETLINNGNNLSSVAKAKEIGMRVQKTTKNFVVTSPYLLVDNQRLNRGEPIWIIDVVSAEAKVLHMGHGRSSQPISGWISIYDLERRSTWRSNPAFFYSNPTSIPPPMPPTTVIYETRPQYPIIIYKHDKRRYDHHGYKGHRGRHDYGKGRRRHNKYINISPRYW